MMKYLQTIFGGPVPQTEPLPGREAEMVANSAGGYVFPVNDWTRVERFLILGSEGGSYYASERKLTVGNAQAVKRAIAADGPRVVKTVVEISGAGRAPKNQPAPRSRGGPWCLRTRSQFLPTPSSGSQRRRSAHHQRAQVARRGRAVPEQEG